MSWVPERDKNGRFFLRISPFSSKELDEKSLFKRVHGVVVNCSEGTNTFDFVVPYDNAKLNELQIMWADEGCTADFKVYDTPTGTISTVPNAQLNQFGFGAGIAKDLFIQHSEYDADVIKDMKLQAIITLPTGAATKDICINFILNELK